MSLNNQLSDLFASFAAIMEIKGENRFKAIAFSKVGRILGDMTIDVREAVEKGTLKEIEGIGESSRKIIEEFVRTGSSKDYQDIATTVPAGLLELLRIPGLGPKTIALFWKERSVTSLAQLVDALDKGTLAGLKGVGEKKLEQIKQGISMLAQASLRMGIVDALPIAQSIVGRLRRMPEVKQAEIAGSLRRRRETIGDVDLICALNEDDDGSVVADAFVKFPEVERILGQGTTKASVITAGGLQVDLRIVPADNFGAALLYFTGSKDHNIRLRGLAQDNGMTLNEWGLYRVSDYEAGAGKAAKGEGHEKKETGKPPAARAVASGTEDEVYKKLDLAWIAPELREDRGEIELARSRTLPRLIELADIRGDLHNHTTASDGVATIQQMAEAAIELGYTFLGITDHSKSQTIAHGLDEKRLMQHVEAIHKVGAKLKGITLLAGCEVDILADGRLDFEDAILKELDLVIASPHIALRQDEGKATDRLLRAIENRYVHIIGHPSGRLINTREGLPLNWSKVIQAAANAGTALEINAGWPRLDINEIHARAAIAQGVLLSINTDSHSVEQFSQMNLGVGVARRAGAEKANVINCWDWPALSKFLSKKRG